MSGYAETYRGQVLASEWPYEYPVLRGPGQPRNLEHELHDWYSA